LNGNGQGRTITDYLLAETQEKLRHAADACELLDRYNTDSLSGSEFRGARRTGKRPNRIKTSFLRLGCREAARWRGLLSFK
jgi:hypothetical protein